MKGTTRVDVGLLVLRIGLGLLFLFYGSQKMFGAFGGNGYSAQVNWFIGQGFPPVLAHLAIVAEFFGSLGVLVGLLTPVAAFGIACVMAVATWVTMTTPGKMHAVFSGSGPDVQRFFYTFALFFMAVALAVMGAGKLSLDAKLFKRK